MKSEAANWIEAEGPQLGAFLAATKAGVIPIQAGRKQLVLVRSGGQLHVLQAKCPHARGPLAGGFVNDTGHLVCPWHRFAFDPASGHSKQGGYVCRTYVFRKQGKRLWVEFPRPWWKFWD
jgi:nitrite reductase/ring-hydroxylating ferredoxin subunit